MTVSPAWRKLLAAKAAKAPRKHFEAGPEHARPGDWYDSECGCRGQYRTGEYSRLVWHVTTECKAHTPPYDPAVTPPCEPARRVKRAPEPPRDSLWVYPCRVCEAPNHNGHESDCVFWLVTDHVPF